MAGGLCLAAAGIAVGVATATRVVYSETPAEVLDALAAAPGQAAASSAAQLAAVLLLLPGLATLCGALVGRGAIAGLAGCVLLGANAVGNAVDVGQSMATQALAAGGVEAAEPGVLATMQEQPLYLANALLVLIGLFGFIFLAVALWRSRLVPRAVSGLLLAGILTLFLPIPEAVGGMLIAAALSWVGVTLAHRGSTPPQSPAEPAEAAGSRTDVTAGFSR